MAVSKKNHNAAKKKLFLASFFHSHREKLLEIGGFPSVSRNLDEKQTAYRSWRLKLD